MKSILLAFALLCAALPAQAQMTRSRSPTTEAAALFRRGDHLAGIYVNLPPCPASPRCADAATVAKIRTLYATAAAALKTAEAKPSEAAAAMTAAKALQAAIPER